MNSSNSANAMISSNLFRISDGVIPSNAPLMWIFSRPLSIGENPAPAAMSAPIRPRSVTFPLSGLYVPLRIRRRVVLPEPLTPTMPSASPGSRTKFTSFNAQNSPGRSVGSFSFPSSRRPLSIRPYLSALLSDNPNFLLTLSTTTDGFCTRVAPLPNLLTGRTLSTQLLRARLYPRPPPRRCRCYRHALSK